MKRWKQVSHVVIYFLGIDVREDEKEDGRQDNGNTSPDVDWTVASILYAASPEENCIALEILVILPEDSALRVVVSTALVRLNR